MYSIGDKVVYGMHGVCLVVDEEARVIDKKTTRYLVLEPLGQDGSRYFVPMHNAVAMAKVRRMLSKEAWTALMESDEVHTDCWVPDENLRKQAYRELISSCNHTRLMQMVYSIYRHKAAQAAAGKKCHLCDENFLRDAEKLLSGEIAIIFETTADQAKHYIRENFKS